MGPAAKTIIAKILALSVPKIFGKTINIFPFFRILKNMSTSLLQKTLKLDEEGKLLLFLN